MSSESSHEEHNPEDDVIELAPYGLDDSAKEADSSFKPDPSLNAMASAPRKQAFTLDRLQANVASVDAFLKRKIPEIEWIFGKWLPHPGLGIVSGETGIGKTMFSASMALSLAAGRPFLEEAPPRRFRVAFVDGELGEQALQHRFRQIRVEKDSELRLVCMPALERDFEIPIDLADPNIQKVFFEWILAKCGWVPEILVLDNAASLFRGVDHSDNFQWLHRINPFLFLARAHGVSVILVDHTGKDSNSGPRGASAKEGPMDFSIILEKSPGHLAKVSYRKNRHGPLPEGFVIDLVEFPDALRDISKLKLVRDVQTTDKERQLLQLIRDSKPHTVADLVIVAVPLGGGWSKSRIYEMVEKLAAKGILEKGPPLSLIE